MALTTTSTNFKALFTSCDPSSHALIVYKIFQYMLPCSHLLNIFLTQGLVTNPTYHPTTTPLHPPHHQPTIHQPSTHHPPTNHPLTHQPPTHQPPPKHPSNLTPTIQPSNHPTTQTPFFSSSPSPFYSTTPPTPPPDHTSQTEHTYINC